MHWSELNNFKAHESLREYQSECESESGDTNSGFFSSLLALSLSKGHAPTHTLIYGIDQNATTLKRTKA